LAPSQTDISLYISQKLLQNRNMLFLSISGESPAAVEIEFCRTTSLWECPVEYDTSSSSYYPINDEQNNRLCDPYKQESQKYKTDFFMFHDYYLSQN